MSHASTPWVAHKPEESNGYVEVLNDDIGSVCTCYSLDADANAAHIAKCVNEHDGLVDALEDALEFLAGYEDVNDGDYGVPEPNAAMQLCNRIREALGRRPGP